MCRGDPHHRVAVLGNRGTGTGPRTRRARSGRAVLAKHWPHVVRFQDVRTFKAPYADVICGGFPCQDVSTAGRGAGLEGERSGLWRDFRRVVSEVRPRFVVVENVASGNAVLPQCAEVIGRVVLDLLSVDMSDTLTTSR